MNRFYSICTFLCVLFSTKVFGQDFHRADSLCKQKQYASALLAYEQVYFELSEFPDTLLTVTQQQEAKNRCILKKVYCQKAAGKFEDASRTTLRFDFTSLSDSVQYPLRHESVVCAYLANQYEDALAQLQQMKFFVKDSTLTQQEDFWEILALTQLKRYDEAKSLFKHYCERKQVRFDINTVFDFASNPRFVNPKKAQALATFLPGAGMLYVGKRSEGFVSLGLQVATLGFGAYNFIQGYYLSGFFTGFGLFQAFYFGGIRRSELLAEQKNIQLSKQYTDRVTKALVAIAMQ